jgi:hypothetical protein
VKNIIEIACLTNYKNYVIIFIESERML